MKIIVWIFSLFLFSGLNAQTAEIYFIRAMTTAENGEDEKALELINKAIDLDSMDGFFYFYRANIQYGSNGPNKKIIHFEKATYDKVMKDVDHAIELNPEDKLYFLTFKINLLIDFGYYSKAEELLNRIDLENASDLDKRSYYLVKSHLRVKTNNEDAGFKNLEEALKLDSTDVFILNGIAYNYMMINDDKAVLKYINKVLSIDPDNELAWVNIAFYSVRTGKNKKAIALHNELIEKYPTTGNLYNNRGEAYYNLGQYETALKDINKAIELASGNSYAYKNRALVYLALDQKEKACEDLQMAKRLKYSLHYDDKVINLLIDNCLKTNQKVKKEK